MRFDAALALTLAASALTLAPGAQGRAADVPAPIREVMEVTTVFWSPRTPKLGSIFSEDRLGRLYSRDFVRVYRAAMRHPIYPNGDTPFDFDVIVQAQDSCTPEDTHIRLVGTLGPVRDYEVSFARLGCFDGGDPNERTTIHFDIVDQDGRAVIDDIVTHEADGKVDSTKVLMANIAAGHPEALYEPSK